MKQYLEKVFEQVYGTQQGVQVFFAPGRVNLIGDHTDYNGGHVFPCALTIGTYAAVCKRKDGLIRLYSENFKAEGIHTVDIGKLPAKKSGGWMDYIIGVMICLKDKGICLNQGFDVAYYGNIPNSSGLSSSASIEVLTAYFLRELYGFELGLEEIAFLSQKAENEYVGLNCGIMDQFAIAMGKKNHAIFLDTNTMEYEYVPIVLKDVSVIIACSNKKRGLSDSKYNERREETELGLRILQRELKINSLGELTLEQFENCKEKIKDPVIRKRVRHAVAENIRTILAVKLLKENDIYGFGKLMIQSHQSLRDDYEVTGFEMDTLFDACSNAPGVIGTRMTGGGFGGCSVSLVQTKYLKEFEEKAAKWYLNKVGYEADFYQVTIGDGPKKP